MMSLTEAPQKRDREIAQINTHEESESKKVKLTTLPSKTSKNKISAARKLILEKLKKLDSKLGRIENNFNLAENNIQNATPIENQSMAQRRGKRNRKQKKLIDEEDFVPTKTESRPKSKPQRRTLKRSKQLVTISELPEEMQKCYRILLSLKRHKLAWPFNEPVDAVALGVPDYYDVIKNPMDLGTITKKLSSGEYTSVDAFIKDVRLVWNNCYTYNPPGSDIVEMAQTLSKIFEEKVKSVLAKYVDETFPNKSKQKKTTRYINAREMTFEEKKILSENIAKLDSEKLTTVVDIIRDAIPQSNNEDQLEIEIDLAKLDNNTLRKLEKFVKSCIAVEKRKQTMKMKSSLPNKENEMDESTDLSETESDTTESSDSDE